MIEVRSVYDVDFIKWLNAQNIAINQVCGMPSYAVKKLISEYLYECYGRVDQEEFKKMYKYFRKKTFNGIKKDYHRISYMRAYNSEDDFYLKAEELMARYDNPDIWKCLFLHLKNVNDFPRFIEKQFDNLDTVSGKHLDIFYNKTDLLHSSGYDIREKFPFLKDISRLSLPCLFLWNDSLNAEHIIDIQHLSHSDMVKLIAGIVDSIEAKKTPEQIFKEADDMSQKFSNDNKPSVTINANNVNGSVTGINNGINITNVSVSVANTQFESDIREIIEKINTLDELQQEQKENLSEILEKLKNSENQNENKITFKGLLMGLGSVAAKVKAIITAYPKVAEFLNLK